MHIHNFSLSILACVLLASCSNETSNDDIQNETIGAQENQEESSLAESPKDTLELTELAQKGERVFLRCQSCHTLGEGEVHLTGPNLHGLFGAKAGTKEGYAFSEALKNSNVTWDRASLNQWIESPQSLIAGNKMAFVGLKSADDREAVIQYLEETTR